MYEDYIESLNSKRSDSQKRSKEDQINDVISWLKKEIKNLENKITKDGIQYPEDIIDRFKMVIQYCYLSINKTIVYKYRKFIKDILDENKERLTEAVNIKDVFKDVANLNKDRFKSFLRTSCGSESHYEDKFIFDFLRPSLIWS